MRNLARLLAAVITLMYLVFGARFMFAPATALSDAAMTAVHAGGLGNVRALLGGTFLAFGVLLGIHTVVKQETETLRFVILHLLMTFVGRLVGLGVDGGHPLSLRNLVPVSVMLVISIVSLKLFLKSEPAAVATA